MQKKESTSQSGFSVIEIILIILAILAIVGLGYWVWAQKNKSITDSNKPSVSQSTETKTTVQNSKDKIVQQLVAEDKIDQTASDEDANIASSAADAASQIGDNSNATDL